MNKTILAAALLVAASAFAIEIPLQDIDSTFIARIGYDADTQTLALQMHNCSDVFHYQNVPANIYEDFRNADSIGRYFVHHIKGQYPAQRVQ